MQRPLAVLLILIGLIGLVLGRLGETTWAPETETTASVTLDSPGAAVVIDPGVLYVGGEEGQVVIEGASDLSVITAANGDIDAYLEDVHYTRITGASDWTTLSTQEVNPEGAAELTDPTSSDLWRSVETTPSPHTMEVADFWEQENGEGEQAYRSLLIVTDGTSPGADKVSITWPVDAENEWVPFAYAGGAAIAVIGLVLLVVSFGGRRRDEDEDWEVEDGGPAPAAPALAGAPAVGTTDIATAEPEPTDPEAEPTDAAAETVAAELGVTDAAVTTDAPASGTEPVREESVWSFGEPSTDEPAADEPISDPAGDESASATGDAPGPEDDAPESAGPARLSGDDEERR